MPWRLNVSFYNVIIQKRFFSLIKKYQTIVVQIFVKWSYLICDSLTVCGGFFVASSNIQYIKSIHYPSTYPNDLDCHWEFRSSTKLIQLTFQDFNLEADKNCSRDYVELWEIISGNKKIIKKLCSTNGFKKTYRSSVSRLFINFHTDGKNSCKGFKASVQEG